jgi:F-type H+-transporting ATPase subunit a
MEKYEHALLIVKWVNELLGPAVARLFAAIEGVIGHNAAQMIGLYPKPGQDIIPTPLIMVTIVVLAMMIIFGILRTRFSVENPSNLQQALESVVEFLESQLEENIGHEGAMFLPLIGTIALFLVFTNLLGLIPGLASPTGDINVPCGCAVFIFLYYNYHGMKKQGVSHYLQHFMGPVWWLAPVMIPIEIISHFARPFSLTVRLYANIFAEDLLIAVFFSLVAFLLPLPFMAFAIFGGFLQAFIFITLSQVYLAGAVATEEH